MKKTFHTISAAVLIAAAWAVPVLAAKKAPKSPPSGTFQVSQGMNRDYCMIRMADGSGKRWPMFWVAHPGASGSVDTSTGRGKFTIVGKGDGMQLSAGKRQSPRIAGSLVTSVQTKDKRGNPVTRRVGPDIALDIAMSSLSAANVTIRFNGKTVSTAATLTVKPSAPTGKGGINISGRCRTTMRDLGLGRESTPVEIEFWAPGR